MFAVYYLTCKTDEEAEKIAGHLLSQKLVVCTKRLPVSSLYPWKGEKGKANEVLLIMEGFEKDFNKIDKEITKLHSYETFVLFSVPISYE